jgi:hypothetical protein
MSSWVMLTAKELLKQLEDHVTEGFAPIQLHI